LISGTSSSLLTKLDGSPWIAFFVQAVTSLLKDAEGEGGGGGSPPSWLDMVAARTLSARTLTQLFLQQLATHNKRDVKAKQMILDAIKDDLIPHF
jgi:hypothetical protein